MSLASAIDGWRAYALLAVLSLALYLPGLAASLAVAAFFLWFGIRRFRKTEATFADLI